MPTRCGIEGRDIAEVVVVEIQLDARMGIHAEGEEVAPQSRAGRRRDGIPSGTVELRRLVDRDVALVGNRVFEEDERPVDRPVHHADAGAGGAAVVEGIVFVRPRN